MAQLYIKRGKRYQPIKEFEGFPAEGIWLVKKVANQKIERCLIYLGEPLEKIPKKYSLILEQFRDEIRREYVNRREREYIFTYESEIDLAFDVIAEFIEKDIKKEVQIPDKIKEHEIKMLRWLEGIDKRIVKIEELLKDKNKRKEV